jgi:BASS family bile acid:Na+ symporter
MTEILLISLKLAVVALIFAIGLSSTPSDLSYLWRRPALLARSLFAMVVLVPAVALLLISLLPLTAGVKAALLVLAVSSGSPLLPRKLGAQGTGGYVFSLVVTSSLLAIVLVPTWVALVGRHLGVEAALDPFFVAGVIAKAFLLPLAVGFALRMAIPTRADRWADRLMTLAWALLVVAAATLLVLHWKIFASVSLPGYAALGAMLVAALTIGHALGGPVPADRTSLAVACATRDVRLAVLVASAYPGPKMTVLVGTYILASAIVTMTYLRWRRMQGAREAALSH